MDVITPGLIAAILYILVAAKLAFLLRESDNAIEHKSLVRISIVIALVTHGASLHPLLFQDDELNLGIYTSISLVSWVVISILLLGIGLRSIASLAVVILPLTALAIFLSLAFSSQNLVPYSTATSIHIATSITAYSLFTIATLQAVYILVAEHKLKNKKPIMFFFPSLPIMDQLLFRLTEVAFGLLSIGLIAGFFAVENIQQQHLTHKIFFSASAWLVFGFLLVGHHGLGWRGTRAARYALFGFLLLGTGFFGSKVALELILERY
jgi:ABC-type uncharacterized transport system permease subunit